MDKFVNFQERIAHKFIIKKLRNKQRFNFGGILMLFYLIDKFYI